MRGPRSKETRQPTTFHQVSRPNAARRRLLRPLSGSHWPSRGLLRYPWRRVMGREVAHKYPKPPPSSQRLGQLLLTRPHFTGAPARLPPTAGQTHSYGLLVPDPACFSDSGPVMLQPTGQRRSESQRGHPRKGETRCLVDTGSSFHFSQLPGGTVVDRGRKGSSGTGTPNVHLLQARVRRTGRRKAQRHSLPGRPRVVATLPATNRHKASAVLYGVPT